MAGWVSPWFILVNIHSYGIVYPNSQNASNPALGDKLIVGNQTNGAKFRFRQVIHHWGHFEHESGLIWHPKNDSLQPSNYDTIHLGDARCSEACFFAIDQPRKGIRHRSWYALHGKDSTVGGTTLKMLKVAKNWGLFASEGYELRFHFIKPNSTDIYRIVKDIVPTHYIYGEWIRLCVVYKPKQLYETNISYFCGRKLSYFESQEIEWELPSWYIRVLITDYELYPDGLWKINDCTCSYTKTNHTMHIKLEAGETIVVWQWKFIVRQFDEDHEFLATPSVQRTVSLPGPYITI